MEDIKLHLGSGKRFLKGYVHVDLADFPHVAYRNDIRDLSMFQDNTVSLIYVSHALEYYDRVEVLGVLKEWRRVLKRGGIVRLAVPDFAALSQIYASSGNLDLVHGPLYGRWQIPGINLVVYHKTVYDFQSLRKVLEEVGFVGVKKWNWRDVFQGELEGFDDYSQAYFPHMDKEHGILISLNVEAEKP